MEKYAPCILCECSLKKFEKINLYSRLLQKNLKMEEKINYKNSSITVATFIIFF